MIVQIIYWVVVAGLLVLTYSDDWMTAIYFAIGFLLGFGGGGYSSWKKNRD